MQLPTVVHGLLWCIFWCVSSWIGQTHCTDIIIDGWVMKGYEMVPWNKDYKNEDSATYLSAVEALQNQISDVENYQIIPFSNNDIKIGRFYAKDGMAKVAFHLSMPDSWSPIKLNISALQTTLEKALGLIQHANGMISEEFDVKGW
ncbi:unnamed protein product [Echinostoma caproni]|uniref:Secreted protein n=1 Tax=Echinostoma caproni TaxID=27848 RepID=A0A183AKU5_9TREM|nr:unnamed protein product [Echinostoma caproni]